MDDFETLLEATLCALQVAEDGSPEGATDSDLVAFVRDRLFEEFSEEINEWIATDAYGGVILGLLQTSRAVRGVSREGFL